MGERGSNGQSPERPVAVASRGALRRIVDRSPGHGPQASEIGPYEPGAPSTAPGDQGLATAALVVLFGYLVLGRSFAQIGVAPLNLFLGEIVLVGCLLVSRLRSGLTGAVQSLANGGPLHALTWVSLAFIGYGLLHVALAAQGGAHPIEALKVFAFNYYVLFVFLGLRVGLLVPDLLERLCRWLPWGVGAFLAISVAGINFSLPLSAAVGLYAGAGAPICMLLMIALERRFARRLPAFVVCAFLWLYLQIRGDWLGVGAAVLVWGALTRRLRVVLAGMFAVMFVFLLLDVAGVRISASSQRGGAVGGREIFGRLIAPFNEELGKQLVPDAEVFAGTAQWREDFWADIRAAVNEDQARQVFGLGYGRPLSELTSFINSDVRTPHNVFYYALGYGGWFGVLAFGAVHLGICVALYRAFRLTGNPFGLMLWSFATLTGLFGNFFETPYNAVPYYVLIGVCLAPLVRRSGWPIFEPALPTLRAPALRPVAARRGSPSATTQRQAEGARQLGPANGQLERQRAEHAGEHPGDEVEGNGSDT